MLDELFADYFDIVKGDGNACQEEIHDLGTEGDNQITDGSSDGGQDDNGDYQQDRVLVQFIYDENAPNGFWYKKIGSDLVGDVDADDIGEDDSTNDDSTESNDQVDSYLIQFVPDETEPDGSGYREVIVIE